MSRTWHGIKYDKVIRYGMSDLKDFVTTIPDFPKPGIMFRDITTIVNSGEGLKLAIDQLLDAIKDLDFDLVVGSESRGFVFGTPVAYERGKGFVLVRKKGKLPRETISESYDLEYGSATLEMHKDAIKPENFLDADIQQWYGPVKGGYHDVYVLEITSALKGE